MTLPVSIYIPLRRYGYGLEPPICFPSILPKLTVLPTTPAPLPLFATILITGQGLKVLVAFQEDSYRKMQALDSLSSSLTTYALDHNQM